MPFDGDTQQVLIAHKHRRCGVNTTYTNNTLVRSVHLTHTRTRATACVDTSMCEMVGGPG